MDIQAKTCHKCEGTGHDRGGMPVVKMVDFNTREGHRKYITDDVEQKRYHQTIKRGSGCTCCGGVGYLSLEVE